MKTKHLTIILGLVLILSACDAIRVVRITNKSTNSIELRTDFPQRTFFLKDSSGNYQEQVEYIKDIKAIRERHNSVQVDTTLEGLIITLQPLQSFDLAGRIGPALIKIQPWDLNFSRLTIYTMTDTIIAGNKQEIIKLFDNDKTKYIRRLDKKDIGFSNKYFKYIIVRK